MRRPAAALACLAALVVVAGCGATTPTTADDPPQGGSDSSSAAPTVSRYAALGDSYTAAPYVYLTDVAKGCLRSDRNYPSLLARDLRVDTLVDVSCSAAATDDLTGSQTTFQAKLPPQLAAVTRATQLVTLGIGGNDFGLFASLSSGCRLLGPGGTPLTASSGTRRCGQVDVATATAEIGSIQRLVTRSLRQVHSRAPGATVVLVGYPRIASTTRSCPAVLPVSHADALVLDRLTHRLSDAMGSAARASGSRFVDMYAASAGHDVCAGKAAWVNGVRTDTERAAPLHPFAAEQRAVADRVAALVR